MGSIRRTLDRREAMATRQFIITPELAQNLKNRLADLDRQLAKLSEERLLIIRQLEAIPLFLSTNGEQPRERSNPLHERIVEEQPSEMSLPMAIKVLLEKRGRLSATEIRDAILAEHFLPPERLGASFSYLYTALTRLRQKKQIERVRGKYQLPHGVAIQFKPEEADLKR